jgi:hypothetical protein
MKHAVWGLILLISLGATCALYGWLESSVNMIEGLRTFFQPGGTILLSPFLVLFIFLCLGVFVGASLVVVAAGAFLGGILLRFRAIPSSPSSFLLFTAVICQFLFVLFAIKQNASFLLGRPRLHPNLYLAAFIAAANAALNLSVAALIVRKQTGKLTPPLLP